MRLIIRTNSNMPSAPVSSVVSFTLRVCAHQFGTQSRRVAFEHTAKFTKHGSHPVIVCFWEYAVRVQGKASKSFYRPLSIASCPLIPHKYDWVYRAFTLSEPVQIWCVV